MQYVMVPDEHLDKLDKDTIEYIERETGSELQIDDSAKTIGIKDNNSVNQMKTRNVMKAISVGFDPQISVKLSYNELYHLEILNVKNMTRNKAEMKRQKSRIIGKNGKTKDLISELTDTDINIYNNKVGIIGENQDVLKSREVIKKLVNGTPHSRIYSELERYKREKNQRIPSNFR